MPLQQSLGVTRLHAFPEVRVTLIEVPNTHAILDPEYGGDQVRRHLSTSVAIGREMASYSADLIVRFLHTAEPEVKNLVIVAGLFRQCLVMFDGALTCLEHGAVSAAIPLNRALLEASLALDWVITMGAERWSHQFYVSSLRQNLIWIHRGLPGTPENTQYFKDLGAMAGDFDMSADAVARRTQDEADTVALLSREPYKSINAAAELYRNPPAPQRKRSEPNWYAYGDGATSNVADMAARLERSGEYAVFYRYGSYYVHGALAEMHSYVANGEAHIYPVRDLRQYPTVFSNIGGLMMTAIVKITQHYRPDELAAIGDTRLKRWSTVLMEMSRTRINVDVVVQ